MENNTWLFLAAREWYYLHCPTRRYPHRGLCRGMHLLDRPLRRSCWPLFWMEKERCRNRTEYWRFKIAAFLNRLRKCNNFGISNLQYAVDVDTCPPAQR